MQDAIATGPIDERDGGKAQKLHRGIEKRVGQNGVAPGEHIVAVALGEFVHGLALAIEKLHDAHARDVFLEEGVDACDGRADAAVGVANVVAKDQRDDQDARQDKEGIESQAAIELEKQCGHDREEKKVVDHGDDARGKEVV